jgi:hypothetical protein
MTIEVEKSHAPPTSGVFNFALMIPFTFVLSYDANQSPTHPKIGRIPTLLTDDRMHFRGCLEF